MSAVMTIRSRRRWSPILLLVLVLSCLKIQAAGLWQGTTYPPVSPPSAIRAPQSHWLLLDTGGSGGAFGKGDIRKDLSDVVFWNRSLGWTCGYGGVFRTVDGGHTWERVLPGGGWRQVEMTGPEEIWLLKGEHPGGLGKVWLLHSPDGGKTWNEKLPGKLDGYRGMVCLDAQRWIIANTAVWHSADGGRNWRTVTFDVDRMRPWGISLPAQHVTDRGFTVFVLVKGRDWQNILFKSDDSGQTWQKTTSLPQEFQSRRYPGFFFADSKRGWLAGERGKLWRTTDGGQTWHAFQLPTSQDVGAMWFDQTGNGFAAVWNRNVDFWGDALFETRDGGQTWIKTLDGAKQINRFYALGPRQVWFVGDVTGRISNDLVGILSTQPDTSQ